MAAGAEVIREFFAALEAEDYPRALSLVDPELQWNPMEGSFTGLDGLATALSEWFEPWDEHHFQADSIEAHGDVTIAEVHITARGGRSRMQVDQRFFQVYRVAGGRITRMDEFVDRADALRAAGEDA